MITKVLRLHPEALLPRYGYAGDAGMDLSVVSRHVLNPGESRDLPTGIAVELPAGFWARITGRSSTLRQRGLFVNEGVIDEGYRGELLVYVTNRQSTPVEILQGDRLAQLILHPVHQAPPVEVGELAPSERGTNGFGSTGLTAQADIDQLQQDGAQDTEQIARMMLSLGRVQPVYLGGAVDASDAVHDEYDWRHSPQWAANEVATYCPKCECTSLLGYDQIIKQNMAALRAAPVAVFDLRDQSIGTPIEAWLRAEELRLPMIILHGDPHNPKPSVFVEFMMRHPWVYTTHSFVGVPAWVASMLRTGPRAIRTSPRANT